MVNSAGSMIKVTEKQSPPHGERSQEKQCQKTNNVHTADWAVTCSNNKTTQLVVSYKEGKKISKLREPRNLYEIRHNYSHINIPRWPVEVKVLPEHPRHLEYHPTAPEIFHAKESSDENEFGSFLVVNEVENGILVYDNSIDQPKCFERAHPGGTPIRTRKRQTAIIHQNNDDNENVLQFESRFESGNLWKAVKIGPYDYQLWLRTDLYTEKYTQWYYFRVENTIPGVEYRFTIMNLMKSSSLYSQGMKPLFYSEAKASEKGTGWHRMGAHIKYYKNELTREDNGTERNLYSLSWTIKFPCSNDCCYFAHCYPYTYTDLQEYLRKLNHDPRLNQYCKQRVLTRTLAGNFVYLLTITNPSKCPSDAKNKRAVIVTSRVHPGETNSSWMMKGLLDYLTSDKQDAKLLRDTFVFKIIPMLNPDGVIVGNYRCSLSGRDLNRNYKTDFKDAFPPVWCTREMIKRVKQERKIILYCDFHGHSRQQNVFIYGCEDRKNISNGFKERVFPMMLSKNCQDKFRFKGCKFKVQKSKSGTGRIVMWNMGIQNSYTLEATFCGSTLGSKSGHHFTMRDYESMGYHLCDTLLDYCDPDMSKYLLVLRELEMLVKNMILERLKEKGLATENMDTSDIDLDRDYVSESSTSGSDSSVSDGPPMQIMYSDKNLKRKKKRLKSRKERNKERTESLVKVGEPVESAVIAKNRAPPSNNKYSPAKPKKQSRPSPVPVARTDQQPPLPHQQKKVTIVRQVNYAKVRHYLESMRNSPSPTKGTDLPNVITPQLRFGTGTCLGLAPADAVALSRSSSLKRWSIRNYSPVVDEVDDEGSFIGRYMARQVNTTGTAKESPENLPEISPSKDDVLKGNKIAHNATKDGREQEHSEEPTEKYCSYHSAMLRQKTAAANEKSAHAKQVPVSQRGESVGKVPCDQDEKECSEIPRPKSDSNLPPLGKSSLDTEKIRRSLDEDLQFPVKNGYSYDKHCNTQKTSQEEKNSLFLRNSTSAAARKRKVQYGITVAELVKDENLPASIT